MKSIDPLQKQFNRLEIEWDSIKQSISNSKSTAADDDHSLLHNSPKELVSLLQLPNECSPSIDNSGLKGRRLFEESDAGSDDNDMTGDGCFDVDEQSEVITEFENYDEKGEAEKGVVTVKSGGGRRGSAERLMVSVVMMFALAVVVFRCSGEYEQILVPT